MEVNNLETNRRAQIGNINIPLLKGDQGYSISRIVRTSGDGGAGTTDTYTVYIDTDPETAIGTFQVVNGTGGDMSKSVYDIDNDDIVDRATGDGNGNEITATYETIENVTALASRVATLEQAGYITRSVADLANYYLKSETYTKQEVNNLCDMIPKFAIEVVSVLPTQDISETTIYLLRDDEETQDVYQEYIYVNNTWERIGGQRIDLSNYYSKDELNGKLVNVGATAPENGERVWFKKSKNLLNISQMETGTKNGMTCSINATTGEITLSGTTTSYTAFTIPCSFSEENTYSCNNWENFNLYMQYNGSGVASANANKTYIGNVNALIIGIKSGITMNKTIKLQVEKGTTATSFEPYVEQGIYVDEKLSYKENKITNYAERVSIKADIVFFNNSQQIIKNVDGLVTMNLTFKANSNINLSQNTTIFILPNELKPSKNIIINAFSISQSLYGVGYLRSSTGEIVVRLGGTLNSNSELQIVGSYYIL